jgi:hypothetical protein
MSTKTIISNDKELYNRGVRSVNTSALSDEKRHEKAEPLKAT